MLNLPLSRNTQFTHHKQMKALDIPNQRASSKPIQIIYNLCVQRIQNFMEKNSKDSFKQYTKLIKHKHLFLLISLKRISKQNLSKIYFKGVQQSEYYKLLFSSSQEYQIVQRQNKTVTRSFIEKEILDGSSNTKIIVIYLQNGISTNNRELLLQLQRIVNEADPLVNKLINIFLKNSQIVEIEQLIRQLEIAAISEINIISIVAQLFDVTKVLINLIINSIRPYKIKQELYKIKLKIFKNLEIQFNNFLSSIIRLKSNRRQNIIQILQIIQKTISISLQKSTVQSLFHYKNQQLQNTYIAEIRIFECLFNTLKASIHSLIAYTLENSIFEILNMPEELAQFFFDGRMIEKICAANHHPLLKLMVQRLQDPDCYFFKFNNLLVQTQEKYLCMFINYLSEKMVI